MEGLNFIVAKVPSFTPKQMLCSSLSLKNKDIFSMANSKCIVIVSSVLIPESQDQEDKDLHQVLII